ncbi:MAG: hypothetical protein HKO59_03910 [Phycisphaerales bacterium]|nr:hypothetical protein [Phycisphaerae bacterium]NNM25127.1 hypothetical protein [Phycisphaerales bacterium]
MVSDRNHSHLGLRNLVALVLLALGLLQLAGVLTGARVLRGIGAASAASPLPKVFSDVDGLETFASTFTLVYDVDGVETRRLITPELYRQLRGPYWRRNVYGAALSYGPRLPPPLWESVFCYGLGPDRAFYAELDLPVAARNVRVQIDTNTRNRDGTWTLAPRCGTAGRAVGAEDAGR